MHFLVKIQLQENLWYNNNILKIKQKIFNHPEFSKEEKDKFYKIYWQFFGSPLDSVGYLLFIIEDLHFFESPFCF